MAILVWNLGVVLNAFLSVLYIATFVRVATLLQSKIDIQRRHRILGLLGALFGIFLQFLGILLVYLQVAEVQHDLLTNETIWPFIVLIGYHFALISLTYLICNESYERSWKLFPAFLIQLVLSIYSIVGAGGYVVVWEDGLVFILYSQLADSITLWMGFFVGTLLLYSAFMNREIAQAGLSSSDDKDTRTPVKPYLYLALANFSQFLVPRAIEGSILDPFSVKIVGTIVGICFAFSVYYFSHTESVEPNSKLVTNDDRCIVEKKPLSLIQLLIPAIAALLFLVITELQPLLTPESKEFLQSQSLLIGTWYGSHLYLNYFAVILPIAFCIISTGSLLIISNKSRIKLIVPRLSWLLITAVFGFLFLLVSRITFGVDAITEQATVMQTIFPFMMTPILVYFLFEKLAKKQVHKTPRAQMSRLELCTLIVFLYCAVFLATFLADLLLLVPPFSQTVDHIFIGAIGPFDGLFWAPIMAIVSYDLFLSVKDMG